MLIWGVDGICGFRGMNEWVIGWETFEVRLGGLKLGFWNWGFEIGVSKLGFWNCIDTIGDKVSGVIDTVEIRKSKKQICRNDLIHW